MAVLPVVLSVVVEVVITIVSAVDMLCGAVVETPAVVVPARVDVTVEGCVVVVDFISVGVVDVVAVLPVVVSVVVEVVITIVSAVDILCGAVVETPAVVVPARVDVTVKDVLLLLFLYLLVSRMLWLYCQWCFQLWLK